MVEKEHHAEGGKAVVPGFSHYGDRHQAVLALSDGTSGDAQIEQTIVCAMCDCFDVFKERQKKYGRGNISEFGAPGVVVRLADKMARLRRSYFDSVGEVSDETIEDTWKDIVNYGLIGLTCHRGKWANG